MRSGYRCPGALHRDTTTRALNERRPSCPPGGAVPTVRVPPTATPAGLESMINFQHIHRRPLFERSVLGNAPPRLGPARTSNFPMAFQHIRVPTHSVGRSNTNRGRSNEYRGETLGGVHTDADPCQAPLRGMSGSLQPTGSLLERREPVRVSEARGRSRHRRATKDGIPQ